MKRINIVMTPLVLAVSIFAYLHAQKELTSRERVPLLKAKYFYCIERARVWNQLAHSYICLLAPEDHDGIRHATKTRARYGRKEDKCRNEAKTILLKICKDASTEDDFNWIYAKTYAADQTDERFLWKTMNNVFRNKHFHPDSLWVAARKDVLGRPQQH